MQHSLLFKAHLSPAMKTGQASSHVATPGFVERLTMQLCLLPSTGACGSALGEFVSHLYS